MDAAMLPASREFGAALSIIQKLRAEGYEAYLAGGCVRDLVLGREPVDYDVATSATPDVVLNMFPRTFAVGAHFGVVLVATCAGAPPGVEEADKQFCTEVATFRSDGAYSDGRHPDAVRYTLSAEEDVRRRDFTINGLLLDPLAIAACKLVQNSVQRRCPRLRRRPRRSGCRARARHWPAGRCALKKIICACCERSALPRASASTWKPIPRAPFALSLHASTP